MQTLTISRTGGRSNYTLSPTRNTGELQDKFAKCTGKARKMALRDTRTKPDFPKFEAGMSTADYVRLFESWGTPCKPVEWAQLNSEPCTLYSGADTCETLPDGFETWEDFDAAQSADAAPESTLAAANDDAAPTVPDPEPAAHEEDVAAPVCAQADDEPAETGAEWFDRIMAENKEKRDDCEARAQKVAPLDSVPFKHSDGERFGIAGPCMSEPGRFRFSYFDSRGAIGHCTRDTLALAMWEALDLGYLYATEDTAPASPPATHSEPEKALPYAGFDPVRGAVYRAHIETAKHSRAIDPTFSGMLRRPRSAGFMVDFMAPEVRAHRNAIAAMVRACRAKRASVPLPADTGPLTTDTGADLGEQSAHRIGRESFERGEAMMSDANLRRAFGSQAERDAYYRGYDDAERAARPAPATHSEPAPARPVYASDHLAWMDVENGRAEPDEYQARVIECFGEVKAGGLFYNSDTYPATAALMTARYGYPDWRGDRGQSDGVANPFGMDCYRANSVIRARAERERERGAAATFTVGQRFARLIFNDGKQRTAAELVTLDPAGFACKLKAKSGRNSVEITCSAYALSMAVIRAEERGKVLAAKRASARPEPIAPMPAEPAPVPGKLDAAPAVDSGPPASDSSADPAEVKREADRAAALADAMARFTRGARVTAEPAHYFDGRPVAGWPNAQFLGTVRDCFDNHGTATVRVKWDSGRTDLTSAARLAIVPLPSEFGPDPLPGELGAAQFDRGRVSLILHNVLVPLQNAAPDGVPSVAGLESEAARLDASAAIMADDDYADDAQRRCGTRIAADYREVARSLRELAEIERARIADIEGDDETTPAPLDGLDVAELDDMADFERAGGIAQPIAPAYRDDAPRATPTPSLRISPSDPRARIPARFAPVYLLQA